MAFKSLDKSRSYHNDYYANRRNKLIELLGGVCVDCGSKEQLEFDHVKQSTKVAAIGSMILTKPWKDTLKEAKKCKLRCYKCHLERTRSLKQHTYGRTSISDSRRYSKLSESSVREIKRLLPTLTHAKIAVKFGVSRSTVSAIAHGRTWTDI